MSETTVRNDAIRNAGIRNDEHRIARRGAWAVFGALGLFLGWATLFPLSAAVIAPGELVSNGQNKLVQHRTGGRVDAILVAEGDRVERGDVIVELDSRDDRAALSALEARYGRLAAARNRLLVEKGDDPQPLSIPLATKSTLRGSQSPIRAVLEQEQREELRFGEERRRAEIAAADARIEALRERSGGLADRLRRMTSARARITDRLRRMRPLVAEGYIAKARMWDLEEKLDREDTARDDVAAQLRTTREEIREARAERARLAAGTGERTARELTQTLAELAELEDGIVAARNRLALASVRAPASGIVTGLTANTVGGVVAPGATVATVVPGDGRTALVVEARLRASDVDNVVTGQRAEIVLAAFRRRDVEPLPGRVTYVAADAGDPNALATGVGASDAGGFYTVRVAFDGPIDPALAARLRSGMPADAFIRAKPRTFLAYMLDPLTDSLSRAFADPD